MKYDNDRLGAALKLYLGSDPLPMHMPGGKRNPDFVSQAFMRDITEIGGFDNLHAPEGLLKDMEECAASLWKACRNKRRSRRRAPAGPRTVRDPSARRGVFRGRRS